MLACVALVTYLGFQRLERLATLQLAENLRTGSINNGANVRSCTTADGLAGVAITRKITVGKDIATTLLATSSRRALATVQADSPATTTTFLALNGVAATAANSSFQIGGTITGGVTTTPIIQFGLNADMPYTGQVSALSSYGTSTVLVTDCVYSN